MVEEHRRLRKLTVEVTLRLLRNSDGVLLADVFLAGHVRFQAVTEWVCDWGGLRRLLRMNIDLLSYTIAQRRGEIGKWAAFVALRHHAFSQDYS